MNIIIRIWKAILSFLCGESKQLVAVSSAEEEEYVRQVEEWNEHNSGEMKIDVMTGKYPKLVRRNES